MSKLTTYKRPLENAILSYTGKESADYYLAPGDIVRHADWTGTKGMLVAVNENFVIVLWTIPPREEYRFNPLSVDEDIYIPYRPNKTAPCPLLPKEQEESASWLMKQWRRMNLGKK